MSEATGTPEALVLEHLSVGHSKRPLVGDINLSVRAGEVVALIGPNGSGKTTILKSVAGLLGPLKGSVHMFGQDIHNIPMRLRAQIMATMFTDRPKTELLRAKDIVDTGRSMDFLMRYFSSRGAKSIRLAALVDKKERREFDVHSDFVGFDLPAGFIVGYGLDYAERYRTLPGIYELLDC